MSSLMLLVAVFLLLPKQAQLKPLVMSTSLPTPTGAKGCEYYGNMYEPGVIYEEQCHGVACVELDGHYELLYWHKFKWCTSTSTTVSTPVPSTLFPTTQAPFHSSSTSGSPTTYPILPGLSSGQPTTYPPYPGAPGGLPTTFPMQPAVTMYWTL